jgi:tRNA dimethylallyltransferase
VEPLPELRAELEREAEQLGNEAMHARLAAIDPEAAANIDARNLRRTLRALEVVQSTGRKFSEQRTRAESPYRVLQLGLMRPRPELYSRIDARIESMLNAGWLDEIKGLLAKGYSPELPSMSAIGYQQLVRHINGELSLEDAVVEIKRATRAFVRRQANWFKPDDVRIRWHAADSPELLNTLENEVGEFLRQSAD